MFSVTLKDGRVEDIKFKKFVHGYNAFLDDKCIAQLFRHSTSWAVVVVGDTPYLRSVRGLRTRLDGVEYALQALGYRS